MAKRGAQRGWRVAELGMSVVYVGPAIDDHRMDVRQLAPSLLALADLLRAVQAAVEPQAPPVSLEIQATPDPGSLDLRLMVVIPNWVEAAGHMLWANDGVLLTHIRETALGVATVLLALKGGKMVKEHRSSQGIVWDLGDGERITIAPDVARSLESVEVRKSVRDVMAPLGHEGVEAVQFKNERRELVLSVPASAAPYFEDVPPPSELTAPERVSQELEMNLRVASSHFEGTSRWKFRPIPEVVRNFKIEARVLDEGFLADAASNVIKVGGLTVLRCRVRRTWAGPADPNPLYEVLQVFDFYELEGPGQQGGLMDALGDDPDD